ncbi:hypothetical protein HAX54_046197 [Datura stramonium]|uniref:Uncharacterized protein n=1 Tax=Datura stramonium TaxID=4076 RepID=A0ABS8WKK2_DATST|nr:hypothetical protein [Datura stramonium]
MNYEAPNPFSFTQTTRLQHRRISPSFSFFSVAAGRNIGSLFSSHHSVWRSPSPLSLFFLFVISLFDHRVSLHSSIQSIASSISVQQPPAKATKTTPVDHLPLLSSKSNVALIVPHCSDERPPPLFR